MMATNRWAAQVVWAARETQRRPGHSILLFACLCTFVFVIATPLLFCNALDITRKRLLEHAPDLVVRRVGTGGWAPLPIAEGVHCAKRIAGVIRATPRLWGVTASSDGPVTLVTMLGSPRIVGGMTPPSAGEAVVGQGVMASADGQQLILGNARPLSVEIVGTFPAETGLVTHDVVWVAAEDARQLLGLAPGQSSDLAIYLFRREEEQAIQSDLAAAFPWPVQITARGSSALRLHARTVRTGGIAVVAGIPALLALLMIIVDITAGDRDQRKRWGLLRVMGWTSADIVRLQVAKAVIVGMPAVILGLAAACGAVFWPAAAGITARWIAGGQHLPVLTLDGSGVLLIVLEIVTLVGVPYLAAVFLTTLKGATGELPTALQGYPWN